MRQYNSKNLKGAKNIKSLKREANLWSLLPSMQKDTAPYCLLQADYMKAAASLFGHCLDTGYNLS